MLSLCYRLESRTPTAILLSIVSHYSAIISREWNLDTKDTTLPDSSPIFSTRSDPLRAPADDLASPLIVSPSFRNQRPSKSSQKLLWSRGHCISLAAGPSHIRRRRSTPLGSFPGDRSRSPEGRQRLREAPVWVGLTFPTAPQWSTLRYLSPPAGHLNFLAGPLNLI